jgi:phosphatidylinositol alpha-1,6-mannosyltransferase
MSKDVLLVTPLFPPDTGGIQNILYNIAKKSEHNIEVLTDIQEDSKEFDEEQDFDIERINLSNISQRLPFNIVGANIKILDYLRKNRDEYDLIYFGTIDYSYTGKVLGEKYISHTYAKELIQPNVGIGPRLNNYLSKKGLKSSNKVIAISKWTENKIKELDVQDKKIERIHPGTDITEIESDEKNIREEFSIGDDETVLLTVSRLDARKGHDLVVEAIEDLDDIHYIVCGDGEHREEIERIINEKNLGNRVHLTGNIPHSEIEEYYTSADIFVMPSKFLEESKNIEGFGVVYLEANAAGLPVIGSTTGGIPSAIKHEETGLTVEPNSENIKDAILKIKNNEDLRNNLGKNGREWAKEHSWNNQISKIDEVIEKI